MADVSNLGSGFAKYFGSAKFLYKYRLLIVIESQIYLRRCSAKLSLNTSELLPPSRQPAQPKRMPQPDGDFTRTIFMATLLQRGICDEAVRRTCPIFRVPPTPTPPVWVKILAWFIRLDRYKYSIRMGRWAAGRERDKGYIAAAAAVVKGTGGVLDVASCAAP